MTTKKSTTKRYYYAAYHSHSIRFVNDISYIVRFTTRAARDAYVNDEPWDGSNYHHESITRDKARRLFPDAFRITDDRDEGLCIDMRDWREDVPGEEFFAPYAI